MQQPDRPARAMTPALGMTPAPGMTPVPGQVPGAGVIASRRRAPTGARRSGYCVTIALDAALIYATLVWPGWRALPFLTERAGLVVPLVITSLLVGALVNLTWLVADPLWWRALGEALNAAVVVAVGVRLWQVFPFDFAAYEHPWALLTRLVLAVIIIGTAVGVLASLIRFAVGLARPDRSRP
jgi:hypothetical protein